MIFFNGRNNSRKVILILTLLFCTPFVRADDMMDVSRIQKGEAKWAPLTDEERASARFVLDLLTSTDSSSLDEWIEELRRDHDPDPNIVRWRHRAEVYTRAVKGKNVTPEYKKEVFRLLCACDVVPRKNVLETVQPVVLSGKEAKAIMAEYYKRAE